MGEVGFALATDAKYQLPQLEFNRKVRRAINALRLFLA
jgi:hypothetical protein